MFCSSLAKTLESLIIGELLNTHSIQIHFNHGSSVVFVIKACLYQCYPIASKALLLLQDYLPAATVSSFHGFVINDLKLP